MFSQDFLELFFKVYKRLYGLQLRLLIAPRWSVPTCSRYGSFILTRSTFVRRLLTESNGDVLLECNCLQRVRVWHLLAFNWPRGVIDCGSAHPAAREGPQPCSGTGCGCARWNDMIYSFSMCVCVCASRFQSSRPNQSGSTAMTSCRDLSGLSGPKPSPVCLRVRVSRAGVAKLDDWSATVAY